MQGSSTGSRLGPAACRSGPLVSRDATYLSLGDKRPRTRRSDLATGLAVAVGLVIVAPGWDPSDPVTRGLAWAVVSGFRYAVVTCAGDCRLATDWPRPRARAIC